MRYKPMRPKHALHLRRVAKPRTSATMIDQDKLRACLEIIKQATDPLRNDRLIIDIEPHMPGADYERIQLLLENLKQGIKILNDGRKKSEKLLFLISDGNAFPDKSYENISD